MSVFSKAKKYRKPSRSIDEKVKLLNQDLEKTGVVVESAPANSSTGVYSHTTFENDGDNVPKVIEDVPDPTGFRDTPTGGSADNASDIDPSDSSTWATGGQGMDDLINPNTLPVENGPDLTDQPVVETPDLTGFKPLRSDPENPDSGMNKYSGVARTSLLGVWGTSTGIIGEGNKFHMVLAAFGWPTGPAGSSETLGDDYPSDRAMFGFYRNDDDATYAARLNMKAMVNNIPEGGKWVPYKCWILFNSYGFGQTWAQYKSNPSNIWREDGYAYVQVSVYAGPGKYNSQEPGKPQTTVVFQGGLGDPNYYPGNPKDDDDDFGDFWDWWQENEDLSDEAVDKAKDEAEQQQNELNDRYGHLSDEELADLGYRRNANGDIVEMTDEEKEAHAAEEKERKALEELRRQAAQLDRILNSDIKLAVTGVIEGIAVWNLAAYVAALIAAGYTSGKIQQMLNGAVENITAEATYLDKLEIQDITEIETSIFLVQADLNSDEKMADLSDAEWDQVRGDQNEKENDAIKRVGEKLRKAQNGGRESVIKAAEKALDKLKKIKAQNKHRRQQVERLRKDAKETVEAGKKALKVWEKFKQSGDIKSGDLPRDVKSLLDALRDTSIKGQVKKIYMRRHLSDKVRNLIRGLNNSYEPQGQVLSESRSRILREIKKPEGEFITEGDPALGWASPKHTDVDKDEKKRWFKEKDIQPEYPKKKPPKMVHDRHPDLLKGPKKDAPKSKDLIKLSDTDLLRNYKVKPDQIKKCRRIITRLNSYITRNPGILIHLRERYPKDDPRLAKLNYKLDMQNEASDEYMSKHFPENEKLFNRVVKATQRSITLTDPKTYKDKKGKMTSYKKLLRVDYVLNEYDPKDSELKIKKIKSDKKSIGRFFRKPKKKTKGDILKDKMAVLDKEMKKTMPDW